MADKRTRQVKLHGRSRPLTGGWGYHPYKVVPWLNVSGVWLEKAGFKIGDQVEITIEDNLLLIKNCTAHGDKAN